MKSLIGETFSHYKIIDFIGQGGMGEVYLAVNAKLKRKVAIKFLPPHLTTDKAAIQRFEREAQAIAALNHPNIITIYEIGEFEGQVFLVMEYVEGETLRRRMSVSTMHIDEILNLIKQICAGLSKTHQVGIIHRDIKPENILIDKDGRVKIVDFGLAKLKGVGNLTEETSTLGTINYMSPEQIKGEKIDHRTDIWSIGVVLYEMIGSAPPFKGEYIPGVIYSILNENPAPLTDNRPNVPAELEYIVSKAIEKNLNKRYKGITEMLDDLKLIQKKYEEYATFGRVSKKDQRWIRSFYVYGGIFLILAVITLIIILNIPGRYSAIDSVAVLPLQNLSNDPQQEYFSDGMTDALITELAKVKTLRVISRTSVIQYKQTIKSLQQIARELDVDAIIEGSVLKELGTVRINTKLIDAKKDRQLWSESYQKNLDNILILQSEIAYDVVRQCKKAITPEEKKRLVRSAYQIIPEAHEAYLRGRFFIQKWTEEDIRKGIDYFELAIKIDPHYAPAYAGLACGYEFMIWLGWLSPKDGWLIVEENAKKALAINETLAEAHIMLAEVKKLYNYDWMGAERSYKTALELNPGFAFAHQTYAWYLSVLERHDEAFAEIELAKKFDPFSAHHYQTAGWLNYHARRFDDMISNIQEALQLNPNFAAAHMILGIAYVEKKMYDLAITEILNAINLEGGNMPVSELACAYALSGQTKKSYELLNKLLKESKYKYIPATYIAAIYAGLGEKDLAIEWLNKGYEQRTHDLITIKVRSCFDTLRSDTRFIALLRKIGLE